MDENVVCFAAVDSLPWHWIIEALANSRLEGVVPFLYELALKAPVSSTDSANNAQEALGLRCLGDLFGVSDGGLTDSRSSRKRFDLSESCWDVLQRVLKETSGLDLQKDVSDEFKWDVRTFVARKKASLPRSTLELLKDAIMVGSHPLVESLKDISGLVLPNQCAPCIPFDEDHDGRVVLPKQPSDSTRPEIVVKPTHSRKPNGNSLPIEKKIGAFCNGSYVPDANGTSSDVKKHKHYGKKQSKEKSSGSSRGKGEQSRQSPKENGKHGQEFNRKNFIGAEKVKVTDSNQPHTLRNANDILLGDIDLQTKLSFMGSHSSFSEEEILALADSEINLCMRCSKSCQLLKCTSSSCPLAFHDSCLGCSATFDDQGNFYCPFCGYSRATSEYSRAREKLSLARKELSLFLGAKNSHQSQHDSKRALEDEDVYHTAKPKNQANVVTQVANPHRLRRSMCRNRKFSTPSGPLSEPKNGKPDKRARVATQVASPLTIK